MLSVITVTDLRDDTLANLAGDGLYTVTMQSNQVKDFSGKAVAKGVLGTFTVEIPPPPEQAVQAPGVKAARPASLPPSREQAAMLAAAADAAQRDRKTAALASLFTSIDDWLW
jgi:hypothetical protein